MAVVQQLTERDCNARQIVCESLLEALPPDTIVFLSDEADFHISGPDEPGPEGTLSCNN